MNCIEREQADSLPFLDIQIIKRPNGAKYKVYRKVTNKEDYIHYFSAHSKRIKSGVVIGFFLRAMRICSEEYLEDECEHIRQSFLNLKYPRAFIVDCYNKAKRIKARVRTHQEEKPKEQIIVVPRSQHSEVISRSIRRTGIRMVEKSGEKIGQLVAAPKTQNKSSNSLVYKIPCKGCNLSYYGETSRGLKKRITEHKRDFRNHKQNNSLVKHLETCPHLPDWEHAEILKDELSKIGRKTLESSLIEAFPCTNTKAGDVRLARSIALALVEEYLGKKVT